MMNNLTKLLATSSLVIGGSFLAVMPANAVQISLADGNFLNVGTYGAKFTGKPLPFPFSGLNTNGAVITQAEFDDVAGGAINTFIAPGSFAKADINTTDISGLLGLYPQIGSVKVKSLDFNNGAWFTPLLSPDVVFDPSVSNKFAVNAAFGNFVEVDNGTDGEAPDLAIELIEITTTQSASLLSGVANIGVGFEGKVRFKTFGPGGQEIVLGTGSVSSTFPSNGTNTAIGTGVLSFEVEKPTPEPSALAGLVAVGLVGSTLVLKKKARLS